VIRSGADPSLYKRPALANRFPTPVLEADHPLIIAPTAPSKHARSLQLLTEAELRHLADYIP